MATSTHGRRRPCPVGHPEQDRLECGQATRTIKLTSVSGSSHFPFLLPRSFSAKGLSGVGPSVGPSLAYAFSLFSSPSSIIRVGFLKIITVVFPMRGVAVVDHRRLFPLVYGWRVGFPPGTAGRSGRRGGGTPGTGRLRAKEEGNKKLVGR